MDAVQQVQPNEIVLLKPGEDPVPIEVQREQRRDEPPASREQLPSQTSDCISEEAPTDVVCRDRVPKLWLRADEQELPPGKSPG